MLARVRVRGGGMSARTNPAQNLDGRTRTAQLADSIARNEPARLRAVASRHGVPTGELDDVVQSALADFVRAFPGPYDQAHALSYTFRCVQNRALKYHRWRARRQAPLVDLYVDDCGEADAIDAVGGSEPDPAERVLERDDYRRSLSRLYELPQELRQIVALRGLGYSGAEIAALTGQSHRAVRKRIESANRLLNCTS
jgi:RNA polymerase sigma factor (sigma-70 family)